MLIIKKKLLDKVPGFHIARRNNGLRRADVNFIGMVQFRVTLEKT
jgi:hypothetical protein